MSLPPTPPLRPVSYPSSSLQTSLSLFDYLGSEQRVSMLTEIVPQECCIFGYNEEYK